LLHTRAAVAKEEEFTLVIRDIFGNVDRPLLGRGVPGPLVDGIKNRDRNPRAARSASDSKEWVISHM
jgi:hypothetical protein